MPMLWLRNLTASDTEPHLRSCSICLFACSPMLAGGHHLDTDRTSLRMLSRALLLRTTGSSLAPIRPSSLSRPRYCSSVTVTVAGVLTGSTWNVPVCGSSRSGELGRSTHPVSVEVSGSSQGVTGHVARKSQEGTGDSSVGKYACQSAHQSGLHPCIGWDSSVPSGGSPAEPAGGEKGMAMIRRRSVGCRGWDRIWPLVAMGETCRR